MIILKSLEEIKKIKKSNQIVGEILQELKVLSIPGVNTLYLNNIAKNKAKERDATPGFLYYKRFPYSICASKNREVVHGFPDKEVLKEGDILSLDFGILLDEYYGDAAITFSIGRVNERNKKLIRITEECLYLGIERAVAGNRLGDISYAIQTHAEENEYGVVRGYGGHGIGKELHEDPHISNVGKPNEGIMLKPGMAIAIEPMLTEGNHKVRVESDGWTVVTEDGKNSAHFEHTIAITNDLPIILSKPGEDNYYAHKKDSAFL